MQCAIIAHGRDRQFRSLIWIVDNGRALCSFRNLCNTNSQFDFAVCVYMHVCDCFFLFILTFYSTDFCVLYANYCCVDFHFSWRRKKKNDQWHFKMNWNPEKKANVDTKMSLAKFNLRHQLEILTPFTGSVWLIFSL